MNKNLKHVAFLLLGGLLLAGTTSCSKDDDNETATAEEGCCTYSYSMLGVTVSSTICQDGTYIVNGEDASFDEAYSDEDWAELVESYEASGYTCN